MALIGTLTSGVSALDAFTQGMEVIGNNIANVDTTGFKGSTVNYADSFSNLLQASSPGTNTTPNTNAMQIGTGVDVNSIKVNFGQGTVTNTGVSSDLAIAGNGYFTVVNPTNSTAYVTRAGNFSIDNNDNLVTATGFNVQGLVSGTPAVTASLVQGVLTYTVAAAGSTKVGNLQVNFPTPGSTTSSGTAVPGVAAGTGITIGATNDPASGTYTQAYLDANAPSMNSYAIDQNGNINITLSNGESYVAGSVLLQNFKNPEALESAGNNNYTNLAAAGPVSGSLSLTGAANAANTNGLGMIKGQSLESSNVDLSAEMTNLITAQRSFEAGSKIITTSDTILQDILSLKPS